MQLATVTRPAPPASSAAAIAAPPGPQSRVLYRLYECGEFQELAIFGGLLRLFAMIAPGRRRLILDRLETLLKATGAI